MAQKYKIKLVNEAHRKKYKGNSQNITLRSSWERDFFQMLMENPKVLSFSSEEVVIPYYFSCDKKMHRYYMDFWFKIQKENGDIKEYLLEVKPFAQTQKPIKNSKRKSSELKYRREMFTYMKNLSKWQAAVNYCKNKGWEFMLLTDGRASIKKYKLWHWTEIGLPFEK